MRLDIKKQLGARIKELRLSKGYSQEYFAEKIGIAPRTLCGIEIGKNFLTATTLEKIIEELQITPQELFFVNHHRSKEKLMQEIIETVNSFNIEKLRIIYKIVKSFES